MIVTPMTVQDIRQEFADALLNKEFVIDKTGVKTIEIVGASFIADENLIFGAVNDGYIARELEWYKSQSLFVKDIPGETPAIWKAIASKHGEINSNYGWAVWSSQNYSQFANCAKELISNPDSRRGIMIYTRPQMQYDFERDGVSDFMCTNNVQYLIRDNKVHAVVNMRSNDCWAGYRNDYAWQLYVLELLTKTVSAESNKEYEVGNIIWNARSLHVYQNQFYLVDHYAKTGEPHIAKKDYVGEWKQ